MISPEYKAQQVQMHENPGYGMASVHYAPIVTRLVNDLRITELLDYGCGKGRLGENLKPIGPLSLWQYDPGVPDIDEPPDPAQMVACIDVLEHVEPEFLESVLDDLQRVTKVMGFFSVHTGPAVKVLPDGRNAHLIQEDYTWWLPKFWSRFEIMAFSQEEQGFYVICKTTQN